MTLAAALDSVRADEHAAALRALLVVWAERPAAELARLVARVGARVDAARPPIPGRTRAELQRGWEERAAPRDPADAGWLLRLLPEGTPDQQELRLRVLADFPRDPRIAAAIREQLAGDLEPAVRRAAITALVKQNDPGTADWWEALDGPAWPGAAGSRAGERVQRHVDSLRARFGEAVAPPPSLEPLERALAVVEATAAASASMPEQLLARIYADPEDEALRLVYADALSENGDPRGELITLQCERAAGRGSAAARERERELLDTHARHWVGGLLPALRANFTFERGFLDRAELRRHADLQQFAGCPEWATVRVLVLTGRQWQSDLAPLLADDRLPALRELRGATASLLEALQTGPEAARAAAHNRVERLRFDCTGDGLYPWSRAAPLVARCDGFPALRELALAQAAELPALPGWLSGAGVLRRLERLEIHAPLRLVRQLLDALDGRPDASVRELTLVDSPWRLSCRLRDGRWDVAARIGTGTRRQREDWLDTLTAALERLRAPRVGALDVAVPRVRREPGLAERLEAIADALGVDELALDV